MSNIKYTIQERYSEETILINAFDSGKMVSHFLCRKQLCCISCNPKLDCTCSKKKEKIWIMRNGPCVIDSHKRIGIGRTMYRIAEIHFKLRIAPDGRANDEGECFRKGYEMRYGSWKEEFKNEVDDHTIPIAELVPFKKEDESFVSVPPAKIL